jgi:long-subunit acyl-CoA synthetase (AMP-forming)
MIYSQLKDHIKPEKFINKIFMNKYIIKQSGLDNIKIAITTNNNIDDKTRQFYKDIDFPLFNSLIMGEATGLISLCLKNTQTNNCVGIPITDIKINSKTNEILLKGDMIFDKYYDDKILKSMDKKWFKTGYYGYLDRDGSLYMK